MTDTRCRYAGDDQPRLTRTHLDTCPDPDTCPGCAPCREGHCQVDGCNEHTTADGRGTDLTCPTCLADTRHAIHRIHDLAQLMATAALEHGVNSLAALHAAPAANYEAWTHHHASMTSGRLCRCARRGTTCPVLLPPTEGPVCDTTVEARGRRRTCTHDSCNRRRGLLCPDLLAWAEDCRDELHPTWVIGTWDFIVRDHYGHTLDLVHTTGPDTAEQTITLDAAVTYLDRCLTGLAHDPDFDFNQLHTETTRCRTHLEDVLGITPHHAKGATCPACERAQLERHNAVTAQDDDIWQCPRPTCMWQLTDAEHYQLLEDTHAEQAPVMTAPELERIHGIPAGSVRGWATRGVIRRAGKTDQGHRLYDVASVLAHRDRGQAVAS